MKILPTIVNWSRFKHNGFRLEDNYVPPTNMPYSIDNKYLNMSWKQVLEDNLQVDNIGISIDFANNKPQINWNYSSLLDALKIMFIYDITIGGNKVGFCINCGGPLFQNSNNSKIYCGESCGSAYRKRRERENLKKEVINLYSSGISVEELIEKYPVHNLTLRKIKKWTKEANEDGIHQTER